MNQLKYTCLVLISCVLILSSYVQASDLLVSEIGASPIEEVIVTADLRNSLESELSTSLTIIDKENISLLSLQHLDDVLNYIPNLNFAGGTSRARHFQIRGIGERSQFGSPINPSVGFIVDDVDFTGIGSLGTLIDLLQIEVLRGPQGTRYGANALAGLINIKSQDPKDNQSAKIKLTLGEYNHETLSLILNQPLTESVSTRFVVEQHKSDGYYSNDFLNAKNTNSRDELTVRGKMKIHVNENWQIQLGITSIDIDNGYDTFSLDNSRTTFSDQPGKDAQKSKSLSLRSKWRLHNFDVQFIFASANSSLNYSYDEDWSFTGFHPFGYTSFDSYEREKDLRSFELRFISNEDFSLFQQDTSWIVGIYRQESEEDLLRQYTFLDSDYKSQYDFITTALFFQLDSSMGDQWSLSVGGRIEKRETTFRDTEGLDFDPNETLWGGRLSLIYDINLSSMIYTSISRGYKSGGFNTDGTLQADLREFDSEYLWEWEAGIKSNWNRLQLRAAIFYDQRRDQQVKSSLVETRIDGSTEFIDFLGNAAKGTNLGLELESHWFLNDAYTLNASLGFLVAKFDNFINEFGEDLSGREQSQAPNYNYHLGITWQQNEWSASFNLVGKDEFFFSDRHDLKSTQYNLLNANLSYKINQYRLSFWGRNLLDKDYTVRGFGSFGNDPRKNYIIEPYVQFGEPRIVGVSLEIEFGQ
ncbi:MAG: TonB-dependent receptor [Pseudomonadales bacterium]|nr:TonB-dependent receptor [Pseudomonadales bacterium]